MIVILPHYILFNFWCMTNTTHMIISLWGLSLFLSSIESSWLCIIVIAFVQMCANSMLNICSLFQELKISWLYLHEKKTHSLIIHTTCVRWNSSMRPCRTFFQYQLISTMSFFFSLLNFFLPFWNGMRWTFQHTLNWNDWYDRVRIVHCIATHVKNYISSGLTWNSLKFKSHTEPVTYLLYIISSTRHTKKYCTIYILPLYSALNFAFIFLSPSFFNDVPFISLFFFSFSSHNPVYRSISIYFFSSHFWKREIFSVVNIKWKMMEKQKQQPVKTVFFFLFHWPCATTV